MVERVLGKFAGGIEAARRRIQPPCASWMAVVDAVGVEVQDGGELVAIRLTLKQVAGIPEPPGLVAAVVVRTEFAENQWDVGVSVREFD